ncbi:MAG TPA: OmpH family outer membrane protein [Candidatus Latescibacteria bacterium]|nr:OmpH family outer membrane protein [Candidatus Latescibacterota bacterium]
MRRQLRLVTLVAAAAIGLAGLVAAQEASKLGVINSQDILDKSVEGQRVLAQLQAANTKYTESITRLDDQIKQLQNRLSAQRLTLTTEAAAAIQADIQKKQTDRQRMAEDASRAMQELQARSLDQLQSEIMPIIEQLRKDKGLDVIFDLGKSGVAFMSPALDLTAEVLRRYDALKAAPPAKK